VVQLKQFDVGTQLRLLRVAAGLTQQDLAMLAGVERRRLSEFERNQIDALDADAVLRVLATLTDPYNGQSARGGMSAHCCGNTIAWSSKRAANRKNVLADKPTTDEESESADQPKRGKFASPDEAGR
jgi:transcriptional regulator with XRE-family HTH domain